jgi:phosphoglycerate dehydrogenase-like enzyme
MHTITLWLTHREVECWNARERHAARLREALPGAVVRLCRDRGEFLNALPDTELAVVWHFEQEWFALAPRLSTVLTPAAGRDFFRVTPPQGVELAYSSFHGRIIAETALGMMLSQCRGLALARELQRDGTWPRAAFSDRCRRLKGAHAVILGFGHIGEHVGRLANAFGARITGLRRDPGTRRPDWFADHDRVLSADLLDRILPEADHLMLSLPGDTGTDNIIDERRLGLLPATAAVYNVGRGNALDEAALDRALRAGKLAGAWLDVFAKEPLDPLSPLRTAPNCVILPHASAIAPDYLDLFIEELAEKVKSEKLKVGKK